MTQSRSGAPRNLALLTVALLACAEPQEPRICADLPTEWDPITAPVSCAPGKGTFRVLLAKSAIETSDDIHAYKPFVDGLRAIAILSVVVGHLELPGASGGFVGVDVFFVISGYLIINQITADIRNRRFSMLDFWARRVLRSASPIRGLTIS